MSSKQRRAELANRKRLLVAQSDLYRAILASEWEGLQRQFKRAEAFRDTMRAGRGWLLGGGLLTALIAGRSFRGMLRWVPHLLAAWRWARRF